MNSAIYRTEISVFDLGLQVAGQIDCLCRAGDGSLIIWDWKRSKDIRDDSREHMRFPLCHLPDSNYWTYALLLNLYRHILESHEYGHMVVGGMFLGIAHPLRAGPLCLEIPRMEREIALIVECERPPGVLL